MEQIQEKSIEAQVVDLFDKEFKMNLTYRGTTLLFENHSPSTIFIMFMEMCKNIKETGVVPTEININIKNEDKEVKEKEIKSDFFKLNDSACEN